MYRYPFSHRLYRKRKIAGPILIGCAIALVLCVLALLNGTLNIVFAAVVFLICVGTAVLVFNSQSKMRSTSEVLVTSDCIRYVDVSFNGYTSTHILNRKHKSDCYFIYNVTNMQVTSSAIYLQGNIVKESTERFNGLVTTNKVQVNTVTIPNYFENREHLIYMINSLGGQ